MNYLDEDITSLNLTFNNTLQSFTSVGKSSVLVTNFSFNTSANINYSLVLNYSSSSFNSSENITIPVEIATTKFIGFFDIKIVSNRLMQRDKFTEIIVLNSTRSV